jgi:hypothetical protein
VFILVDPNEESMKAASMSSSVSSDEMYAAASAIDTSWYCRIGMHTHTHRPNATMCATRRELISKGAFGSLGGLFCDGEGSWALLFGCLFPILSSLLVQPIACLVADSSVMW